MRPGLRTIRPWRRFAALVAGLAAILITVTACETLDSRLTRNQAAFNALPPAHQSLIRQGKLQVGFSPVEVYLAWGAPSHKTFTEDAQGKIESWIYTSTQTDTYYREERYFDRDLGRWRFIDRPFYRHREFVIQEAVFTNGTLSSFTLYPEARPFF